MPQPPRSASPFLLRLTCAGFLLAGLGFASSSLSAPGFFSAQGFIGPAYEGATGSPTGSKPESKLWFADGQWWGILWSTAAQSHSIYRLDRSTQTWIDTDVACDARPKSRADCLWDGARLYVASHQSTSGTGTSSNPLLLYRYGYRPSAQRFALDTGFPTEIGDSSTATLVIDKDSTGRLWAVWKRDLRVWVAHSRTEDRDWSTPVVLAACTSDTNPDDVCSLVSFGGNRVGVLWSDGVSDAFWFTEHVDGAPDGDWTARVAVLSGPGIADDHVNLKSSTDGRVFAAVKTGTDEIRLLVRSTLGIWTNTLVSAASALWTRPILLLNERERFLYCFATSPAPTGAIRRKFSGLDTLGFAAGNGVVVLQDSNDPSFNDATSTKQSVSPESGFVVLASQQVSRRYGHAFDALGGPGVTPPVAAFGAGPAAGYAPLRVQFVDGSRGLPSTWAWSFGDGGSSTARHPAHVYSTSGTYTVTLTVTNAQGSDPETRIGLITVVPAPTALTLSAHADAQVRQLSPESNYGSLATLRVRQDPSSDYHSYLKFLLPETENQVTAAKLRLWVEDGGPDGGTLYPVASTWSESLLDWKNAPDLLGPLTSFGTVATGTWVERDLSAALIGGGLVSFGLANASTNSILYSSREGTHPAELQLVLAPPGPPSAAFEGAPLRAPPPLTVQFFDLSSGGATTLAWDFGDGTTSSFRNPSHVYGRPGTYSVSLFVTSSHGSDVALRTGYVTVLPHIRRSGPP